MPPRAETSPSRREPRITAAQRAQLIDRLVEHTQEQMQNLVFSPNWDRIGPYADLIGMVGVLKGGTNLKPSHQLHLRKMIALETSLVSWPSRVSYIKEFEAAVKSETQPELATMKDFPEDLHGLPKAWDNAYADLAELMQRTQYSDANSRD